MNVRMTISKYPGKVEMLYICRFIQKTYISSLIMKNNILSWLQIFIIVDVMIYMAMPKTTETC